jgi:urate oxidase
MLAENSYGKSGIRLVRVTRAPGRHELKDVTVSVRLEGDFEAAHESGDNGAVLPTDTMKNTVYAFASRTPLEPIEAFGLALAEHFVRSHAPVSRASVGIAEHAWERVEVSGRPHGTAFRRAGAETRRTDVAFARGGKASVRSGVEDLDVMKTAQSGFSGFARDHYTTLKETDDRIFATSVRALWTYASADVPFGVLARAIRQTLLETFAEHDSHSVQHTLDAMGEAVLERHPEVEDVRLSMPNRHHLPFDLAPFGLENRNEIFVPTREPYGLIEARVARRADRAVAADRRREAES